MKNNIKKMVQNYVSVILKACQELIIPTRIQCYVKHSSLKLQHTDIFMLLMLFYLHIFYGICIHVYIILLICYF